MGRLCWNGLGRLVAEVQAMKVLENSVPYQFTMRIERVKLHTCSSCICICGRLAIYKMVTGNIHIWVFFRSWFHDIGDGSQSSMFMGILQRLQNQD